MVILTTLDGPRGAHEESLRAFMSIAGAWFAGRPPAVLAWGKPTSEVVRNADPFSPGELDLTGHQIIRCMLYADPVGELGTVLCSSTWRD